MDLLFTHTDTQNVEQGIEPKIPPPSVPLPPPPPSSFFLI